jgi:hypothetical protein
MTAPNEIVNKVDKSGIITLDLEQLIPNKEERNIDIKDQLFQGLLLREKDFRLWVKEHSWEQYSNCYVAVYCSSDAIVPTWAYMLIASALSPFTDQVYYTKPENLAGLIAERQLSHINPLDYTDKRVVIKGCGDREIDNQGYVKLTSMLVAVAKSVMFGEPCSTVPVYKKR